MNIFSLLENLEKADPEVYDRLDTRRKAMAGFASVGKKLSLAAMPLALSSLFNKAYGAGNSDVLDALQLALAAEYLEGSFYAYGVGHAADLGMSDGLRRGIAMIAQDENAHIYLLQQTIRGLGGRPLRGGDETVANKDFGVDLTGGGGLGGGPLDPALVNLTNYMAGAEAISDLGVRAYKGQATRLMSNNYVLLRALDIHAVEARHTSYIRFHRRKMLNDTGITPWISEKDPHLSASTLAAQSQPIYEAGTDPLMYPAEDNVMQAGIDISAIPGISHKAATEAFDEPLDKQYLLNLLGVPGSGKGSPNARFFY